MSRRLSRRQLIGGAVAGAGAVVLTRDLTFPGSGDAAGARGRVVVLGGGLAGLTAAYELERRGFETQLIEARDRLGGRVHTIYDFEDGQHGESGAEGIDVNHDDILRLCRRFDLPLENAYRGYGDRVGTIYRRGRNIPGDRFRTAADKREIARFYRRIDELSRPLSIADPTANGGAKQDRLSVADLLDQMRIGGRARWLIAKAIESDYGFDVGRTSLLYVTLGERIYRDVPGPGVERWRIKGGNSLLVDELAGRLLTPPMLESPATAVRWGDSGVEVDTGGSGGGTVTGDRLVLALPTKPLRSIDFSPSLPKRQASAIAELDLCAVAKTLIQYDHRIWRRQGRNSFATTDLGIGQTWDTTDAQRGKPGILIAYAAGKDGIRAANRTADERIASARPEIDLLFPGSERISGDAYSVAWRAEPYSGGCWVAFRPGQISKHWLALHDPVGPIHMAGEHTQVLSGYMSSAIASGNRVAREIDAC